VGAGGGGGATRPVASRSRNPDEPAIAELIVSLARGEDAGGRQ